MSRITWKEFLTVISLILIVYYILVILLYCRKELQQLLLTKNNYLSITEDQELVKEIPASATQQTIVTITELIQKASISQSPKEEILFSIQRLLSSSAYQEARQLSFRADINQCIVAECQKHCSIHLSEEDLRVVWT